jgi:hypothetical protein
MIHVVFADGIEGSVRINDEFSGVALPLKEPQEFASAHIIDDGYAIGFKSCEYDICSQWIFEQISKTISSVAAV